MANKHMILVCVTPQHTCRHLIRCGLRLAEEQDAEMRIVSVLPLRQSVAPDLAALDSLNDLARESGAEMTVAFSDDPSGSVSRMALECGASALLTGFPGKDSTHFVLSLHERIPHIPLWMADSDGTAYMIGHAPKTEILTVADATFRIPLRDAT